MTNSILFRAQSGVALLVAISWCVGCVSGGEPGYQPNRYGVDFYEPFDNSRSYGPAYLVGPPNQAKLFPNDHGARSSGRSIELSPNSAPSIPSTPANPRLPPSPVQTPVQ